MTLEELAAQKAAQSAHEVQQPTPAADIPQEAAAQEVQEITERPLDLVFTATGKEFELPEQLEEYRKDNPVGAAQWEEQQKKAAAVQRANEIIKNLPFVQFAMDFLRSPEDALLSWDRLSKYYPEWSRKHFESLISRVSRKYDEDIEQMRNPETRTEKQQRYILEAAAEETEHRINLFFDSNYMQAVNALEPLPGKYPPYKDEIKATEPETYKNDDLSYSLKETTVLYFFAKHSEIKPDSPQALTDADITELTQMFFRMDNYFMENTNGGKDAEPEKLLFDFIEHDNRPEEPQQEEPQQEQPQSKFAAAEQQNALTTIGNRLFVPSDPEYQNAFITSVSANIGLFGIGQGGKKRQLALNLNTEFLRMLAKAVFIDYLNGNKSDMGTSLYFPSIARELGIDINHNHFTEEPAANAQEVQEGKTKASRYDVRQQFIHSVIDELDNIWGKLPHDATEYKLISVHAYNPETEVLYFVSPYLQRLIGALVDKEAAQLNGGKHYYLWSCDLLHATAANERNPAAVEMATRILVGVQQRGLTPDAKLKQNKNRRLKDETAVTWQISCAGLIEDCPQIREKLKQQPNTSRKTQTIKRTFTAMYRILKTKSDLFNYYSDLTITETIPTAKTLNAAIIVTHHGGNTKYKRPALPLKDNAQEVQEGSPE